jgi:Protein of unknown function DUF86
VPLALTFRQSHERRLHSLPHCLRAPRALHALPLGHVWHEVMIPSYAPKPTKSLIGGTRSWGLHRPQQAAGRVSDEIKARFPDVAWQQPVRLRNRIVHGCWSIDLGVLHTTASEQLAGFTRRVAPGPPRAPRRGLRDDADSPFGPAQRALGR